MCAVAQENTRPLGILGCLAVGRIQDVERVGAGDLIGDGIEGVFKFGAAIGLVGAGACDGICSKASHHLAGCKPAIAYINEVIAFIAAFACITCSSNNVVEFWI